MGKPTHFVPGADPHTVMEAWTNELAADNEIGYLHFADWLMTAATSDERHAVAMHWNWDLGEDPLYWIITRPDCDQATAMAVFWLLDPPFFDHAHATKDPGLGSLQEVDALFVGIIDRWKSGFYVRAELSIDLDQVSSDWRQTLASYVDEHGAGVLERIPEDLRQSRPGRQIDDWAMFWGLRSRFNADFGYWSYSETERGEGAE